MKTIRFTPLLWILALVACQAQVTTTASPATAVPSRPTAAIEAQTRLRLGDRLLLDLVRDLPGCFTLREIRYSPDGLFFLALPDCFEGDNEVVVFSSDGQISFRITGQWDKVSYDNIEWSPDSRSLVYQRINSCCADVPPQAPPAGLVQFQVETQQKLILIAASNPPGFTYPTSPKWSPDGRWIAYLHGSDMPGSEIRLYETSSAAIWSLGASNEHPYSLDLTWHTDSDQVRYLLSLTHTNGSPLAEYEIAVNPLSDPPGIKIQ